MDALRSGEGKSQLCWKRSAERKEKWKVTEKAYVSTFLLHPLESESEPGELLEAWGEKFLVLPFS